MIFLFYWAPTFSVSDFNNDLLKLNILAGNFSTLLQYNGVTQLLATATRTSKGLATLIDHVSHNPFVDNLECGILVRGLFKHSATFVKVLLSSKNFDVTEVRCKVFPSIFIEIARHVFGNYSQMSCKCRIPTVTLMRFLHCF